MVIKILPFLLFLSTVLVHSASNMCLTSYCDTDGPVIQFPFWLQSTQQQQMKCALSGFNVRCNGQKYPILNIRDSGDFYLTSVNYNIRVVTLQDVEGCLPTRLLSLNLLSTPLLAIMYRTYTLFSCAKDKESYRTGVVECASSETFDVVATRADVAEGLYSGCSKIATIPIPVSSSNFVHGILPIDLELTWNVSFTKEKNKLSESTRVALILLVPIMFFLIAIVVFVCTKKRGSQRNSTNSSIQISEAGAITSRGLDSSTIEAYAKIMIGDTLVEGPNGVTCTICLTDYATNDTIRFMPSCEHYFHVECIDKWLSMSRNCPVCRISLQNGNS